MKKHRTLRIPKKFNWKQIAVIVAVAAIGTIVLVRSFAAGPATLTATVSPSSGVVNTNFTVSIYENSGDEPVNFVQADLNYDQNKLKFVSIDTTTSAFEGQVNQTGGSGLVSIARYVLPEKTLTQNQLVAKVNFQAIAGSGKSDLTFANSSYLVSSRTNTDIWNGSATGGSFTITTSGGSGGSGSGGSGGGTTTPPSSGGSSSGSSTPTGGSTTKPSASGSTKTTAKPSTTTPAPTQSTPTTSTPTNSSPTVSVSGTANKVATTSKKSQPWVTYGVIAVVLIGGVWVGINWYRSRAFRPHFESASGDAKAFVGGVTPLPVQTIPEVTTPTSSPKTPATPLVTAPKATTITPSSAPKPTEVAKPTTPPSPQAKSS